MRIIEGDITLKLFDLIDESAELLLKNQKEYEELENELTQFLTSLVDVNDNYIGVSSRVKSENSLRSKIIKRKYYLKYDNAEDIINNLSDIIGITLECRFKEDEIKLYNQIKHSFIVSHNEYFKSKVNGNIYMNFNMEQPQSQSNGFDIYRIDGYILKDKVRINFELQIKSLINTFWSGIEHEVMYKNNNFLMFDSFLKELLISVKSNLDIIDSQLTQIYTEMTHKSNYSIGMDGTNFKSFLGKEINNLFSHKLKETAEIDIDIKKLSALLSHYLYIEDFVNNSSPQIVMLDYFEKLDLLSKTDMDFTSRIDIVEDISNGDSFQSEFGNYCLEVLNVDFDWHVLFSMLFILQDNETVVNFNKFITFIKKLLFEPRWYSEKTDKLSKIKGLENIKEDVYSLVAQSLIKCESVSVIYEENLYGIMMIIRRFIDNLLQLSDKEELIDIEGKYEQLRNDISEVFNN